MPKECRPTRLGNLPTHTHRDDRCTQDADPVNLVFVGLSPSSIETGLVGRTSEATGGTWRRAPGSAQWLTAPGGCARHVAQLAAGHIWNRIHVRLWPWDDDTQVRAVGAAHHEYGITLGVAGSPINALHNVTSFETGREAVSRTLREAGFAIDDRGVPLHDVRLLPYSSGEADVVREARDG